MGKTHLAYSFLMLVIELFEYHQRREMGPAKKKIFKQRYHKMLGKIYKQFNYVNINMSCNVNTECFL